MELISQIPVFGGLVSTILAFVVTLGVIVFIHEYGHYIIGRWSGIGAETFSLGFGPVLWSRVDKRGTKWQVAAIPLGGYVKFVGDRGVASTADSEKMAGMEPADIARSFPAAKLWKRAATVAAGPIANFLLAIVIFSGLILSQGMLSDRPIVGEVLSFPDQGYDLQPGDEIEAVNGIAVSSYADIYEATMAMEPAGDMQVKVLRNGEERTVKTPYLYPAAVYGVQPLSAADEAGLQSGDILLEANGQKLVSFLDLKDIVETSQDTEIALKVWRDGKMIPLNITPKLLEYPNDAGGFDKRVMIGVSGSPAFLPLTQSVPVLTALKLGVMQVYDVTAMSLNGLKHMFIGDLSPTNLQGPVGIAQMAEATASQGAYSFFSFMGMISLGVGLLNLFPIPMLDGGHLLFYGIEAIRGKPLGQKTIESAVSIGLAMMLLLMVFVTYNDILRF